MESDRYVYAFMQDGRPCESTHESLKDAVNSACHHLETEDAMVFSIQGEGEFTLSGIDIIEIFPDWQKWRDGVGHHPALGLESGS